MKTYTTVIESKTESFITLPDELGYKPGDKFSCEVQPDNSIVLKPFVDVEVDIDDDTFLSIAKYAHERDITINDAAIEILSDTLNRESFKERLTEQTIKACSE